MYSKRTCSAVLAGFVLLLLLGALPSAPGPVPAMSRAGLDKRASSQPGPRAPRPAPPPPDPEAVHLIGQALAALEPTRLTSVETRLWQRVKVGRLEYETEGRYLLAPDARSRLELHTRIGTKTGALVQVCDGRYHWQGTRTEPDRWQQVHRALATTAAPGLPGHPGAEEAGSDSFAGVYPLVWNLYQQLVWTRHDKASLGITECHRLTGTWSPAVANTLVPQGAAWPEALPGQCRLWLDARTFWPCRLEWFSMPEREGGDAKLLAEMELRSPVFQPVLSEARCQSEFRFDPGTTPVRDPSSGHKRSQVAELSLRR